jgi:GT2 family glycosyltransferase
MSVLFVVPTLGERPDLLEHCLESVTEQQGPSVDLVLVAPVGRGVEAVAERFGGRFVPDPGRGGMSGALNAGLQAAGPGTRYFAWLGDDDLLAPGSLQATCSQLDRHADAVVAYGWCDYIDDSGQVVFRSRAGRVARWILTFGPNLVPQPGSLMRYDAVRHVGGVDESLRFALDLDLFLRLRREGRFVALPRTLASFRWHADSATVSSGEQSMEESDQVRMRYMPPAARRTYEYLRWPGRWALAAAKQRVEHNVAREAARR